MKLNILGKNHQTKKIKAFTLLEMIMVIIIIGVLAASLAYLKPNSDPIKEQQEFGIQAAKEMYNTIKTDQLNIIRKEQQEFGTEFKTIEYMKIYADTSPVDTLKIDINYGKTYPQTEQRLTYKNNKYSNSIIGFINADKNRIKIDKNNNFTLSNIEYFETQACNLSLKNCIPISQIKFNAAAQTITQYFCKEIEYTTKGEYICTDKERENNSSSSSSSSSSSVNIGL